MSDPIGKTVNVACQITSPGRGAIATVWVHGPDAVAAVDQFFRAQSGRKLRDTPVERVVYGTWRHAVGPEDVVVVRLNDESVEVHSHGGSVAPRSILDNLAGCGFGEIGQTDVLRRIHGNPWQASAVESAETALTLSAANRLLLNADGRLARAVEELAEMIADPLRDEESAERLSSLRATFGFGQRLIHGWHIAIAGRPNVGKSSLINRLVGFSRSIVFDQPGTTRDVVEQCTAVAGWPVKLCDTAGLREHGDPIEQVGIASAKLAIEQADLTIWVSDLSQPWTAEDQQAIDAIGNLLLVHNKSDLPRAPGARPEGLIVSLINDPSIETVLRAIELRLFATLPSKESPFLVQPWQTEVLAKVQHLLSVGERASALQLLS